MLMPIKVLTRDTYKSVRYLITVEDAKYLADLAKSKNLFIMEGLWTNFFPAVEKARQIVQRGELGEKAISNLLGSFGFEKEVLYKKVSKPPKERGSSRERR